MAVHAACLHLAERGIRPTLDEVQKITGGGQTRISEHVKTWWAMNPQYEYLRRQRRRRVNRISANNETVREVADWIIEVIRIGSEAHWRLPFIPLTVRFMADERLKELSSNSMRRVQQCGGRQSECDEYVVGSDRSKRETNFNDDDIDRLDGA